MAFRGRGRGRGFGGSDYKFAKQEPFVLFPDIELPDRNNVPEEKRLAVLNYRFRNYFHNSPYNLDETFSEEETVDIERYSDKVKGNSRFGRESLTNSGYLKLEPGYFPLELVQGTKCRKRKVQWNPKRDLQKLDFLEDLEKLQNNEDKKGKKEKEGEDDEQEDEDVEEEEEDEVDSDDDYGKGENFDDDDDDYNVASDGDDEAAM
ncbi:hypothetical protein BVRB_4g073500 [Beta vulgaris subsp. vulgaris]|uniref:uncharacterized protein LOC104890066 n=1 Tax=Beta vulgaris subsp. vulgaris TaxID=3555 RepID=UPI00053F5751|nr:uncharacterized protein LOC104890066 [Beta vulgaris subsp. vulgaris]KMT14580.1 hypothetical protein BVRB_4g073500 [Beta vulgaris subsp. vulgaris]